MSVLPQIPPQIVSVDDYEPLARARLEDTGWAFINGGAADEVTMRWNREGYERLRLQGRVLTDMAGAHTRVTLFGSTFEFPILLAPVAYQKAIHPDGELATVEGASAMGAGMIVSTNATVLLEDLAAAAQSPLWFQLYMMADRGFARDLVQRAAAAGFKALVLTVDAPVNGVRYREQRAGFRLLDIDPVNLRGLRRPYPTKPPSLIESPLFSGFLDTMATWKDIEWLQSCTGLPLLLKGVMSAADAERAIAAGVSGLIISNHGGRTLDTLPATIDILPHIVSQVNGRVPLLVDGGIRRGTDVLKALALGANAVLIGRPYMYGLATAGAVGVAHVLSMLRAELEVAMTLTGCPTVDRIDRSVLWEP